MPGTASGWCVRLLIVLATGAHLVGAGAVHAQDPAVDDSFPTVRSMGLPNAYRPHAALGFGLSLRGPGARLLTRATLGISRDLTNPTPGLLGATAEVWAGTTDREIDGGARLLAGFPAAGLRAGFEYGARPNRFDMILSVWEPFRRGGMLLPGAGMRLDWIPASGSLVASIGVPFSQPVGRTRPGQIGVTPVPIADVPPPSIVDSSLGTAAAELAESARWIARTTLVALPAGEPRASRAVNERLLTHLVGDRATSSFPRGAKQDVTGYHLQMTRLFAGALGLASSDTASETVRRVTAAARSALLNEVLLPFDRDLGQLRDRAVLAALRRRSDAAFRGRLVAESLVPANMRDRVQAAYGALLATIGQIAESEEASWGDSRLVWLPLQLALRPEDHDSQSELDSLVARLSDAPFLPGHDLDYATDERFEPALRRSILEAKHYHVLWIHDFAGRSPSGRPDTVAKRVVLDAYLAALEEAAREFDVTRRVPTFLILLDRYYYRRSVSDRWLQLLEDPLGYRFRLRARFRDVESEVHAAQERLRAAVAASPALQQEVERRGQRWLRRLVSVHVSVTNPPDPSFRGPAFVGSPSFSVPDDVMRDHRKIAFADIDERDPTSGVAILTGLGVGESYGRFRWLDRTIVLRGPSAATLKREARELLVSQGFTPGKIPAVLRPSPVGGPPVPTPSSWSARVAIAMNATGYGPKYATAAKAALYTLMPAGSTIVATDPQWLSRFWGGMLLGAALRGSKVLIIGPGPENAPFRRAFVQRVLQRELFLRLIEARAILREPLAASGGMLQVGLFRIGLGTYNVAGGVRAVRDGLRRYRFIREVLPFHRSVWDLFEQSDSLLLSLGEAGQDADSVYHPAFHLKTQFFGTATAMRDAVGRPEWRQFFARRIRERLHESPAGTDITLAALAPLRPYLDGRSPEVRERQALYLTVGSHNQDTRSLMLDGEAICMVSGESALVSVGDMLLLSTVGVEWIETAGELDRSFPAWDDIRTQAARALENVF